ncbi:sodium:alanine symporter family protein [Candidatus Babeliales bacterium]|nr:sodium:alanine symporter family protein [Candidatus Babeliales bacterium]MBP9843658.1 sodium:alanine symporter family protein [Candidatus Babeliales bacterium]
MFSSIFSFLETAEDLFWVYGGVPTLMLVGIYFTVLSRGFQLVKFPSVLKNFYNIIFDTSENKDGVRPLYVFFASIGGCIGIGNVVGVCTAVQYGGPGAVFWMWVAGFFGMLVKYSEIYLGMKYRVADGKGGYLGGPIIYLQQLPGGKLLANIVAFLLCIYGLEIYIFRTIADSVIEGWGVYPPLVIFSLIGLVILVGEGGINLVGKVSSIILPVFLTAFVLMSLFVFVVNIHQFPGMIQLIFASAFTSHATIGAFAGCSVIMTMSQGVRRACYTGDLGIGYASIIHSQTSETDPNREASMGIMAIFLDTFVICSLSLFLILLTGTWHSGVHEKLMVATALGAYFPFVNALWPLFIFLLGYTSLTSFYAVGKNAAYFLFGSAGDKMYPFVATVLFIAFPYFGDMSHAMTFMSITGALLLMFNVYGILRLSDKIKFKLS